LRLRPKVQNHEEERQYDGKQPDRPSGGYKKQPATARLRRSTLFFHRTPSGEILARSASKTTDPLFAQLALFLVGELKVVLDEESMRAGKPWQAEHDGILGFGSSQFQFLSRYEAGGGGGGGVSARREGDGENKLIGHCRVGGRVDPNESDRQRSYGRRRTVASANLLPRRGLHRGRRIQRRPPGHARAR